MFGSLNVFQMVVLMLILVGVVMIFMRQNNTCVMKQNKVKEGFTSRGKTSWIKRNINDDVNYYNNYKYPGNSSDNYVNFCQDGINKGLCGFGKFRNACRDECSRSSNLIR